MTLGDLHEGEFAITDRGLGVLCLSPRSFEPKYEDCVNVVNLANGIGAFLPGDVCTKVTKAEAFEAALEYGGY